MFNSTRNTRRLVRLVRLVSVAAAAFALIALAPAPASAITYGREGEWGDLQVTCNTTNHTVTFQLRMKAPGEVDEPLAFKIRSWRWDAARRQWTDYGYTPTYQGYYDINTTWTSAPTSGYWIFDVVWGFWTNGRFELRTERITQYQQWVGYPTGAHPSNYQYCMT